jgi:hypothetical protein
LVDLLIGIYLVPIAKGANMTVKKKVVRKKELPKIDPQPVQLKFLQAQESIVFFGGGAKPSGSTLKNLSNCWKP